MTKNQTDPLDNVLETPGPEATTAKQAAALYEMVCLSLRALAMQADETKAKNYVGFVFDGLSLPFDRAEIHLIRPGGMTPIQRAEMLQAMLDEHAGSVSGPAARRIRDDLLARTCQRCDDVVESREVLDANIRCNACCDKLDATRYRRIRVLGAAPCGSPHFKNNTVATFTGLDKLIDQSIQEQPCNESAGHDLDKIDARRYRQLRSVGTAAKPYDSPNIIVAFTELDDLIDQDIRIHPSRGEAKP